MQHIQGLSFLCDPSAFCDVYKNRSYKYDTRYDLLPVGLKSDIRESCLEQYYNKDALKGSYDGSVTSCSRNASYKHTADSVKFKTRTGSRLYRGNNRRISNGGKPCEKSASWRTFPESSG